MPRLTYTEACHIAGKNGADGSAVEGNELECYSRAYMRPVLDAQIARMARRLRIDKTEGWSDAGYNPEKAWWAWQYVADQVELNYSATSLAYGMSGFKPAARHAIDRDGRQMAALYMERRWRLAVFQAAGVPITDSLLADCNSEED